MRKPNALSFSLPFLVVAAVASAACVGGDPVSTGGPAGADGGGTDGGATDAGGGNDGGSTDSGNDAGLADIDGNVIDEFGKPVDGATVRVGTTKVTTGGDGHFHFALVTPAYDLDVVSAGPSGQKEVTSFRGLTTRTPQANVNSALTGARTTPLSGTISPAPTYGVNEHIRIADTEQYFGFDQPQCATDPASSWTGTGVWLGPTQTPITLFAYKYVATTADATPTQFLGYMRTTRTWTNGTPDSSLVLSFTSASTATLSGTVSNVPAGAGSASVDAVLKHSSDPYGHYFQSTAGVTSAFSFATPSAASLSVNVSASAGTSSGGLSESHRVWKANVASNATNVALAFGTAAAGTSPANAATGVKNDTAFSWSGGTPAGVYMLVIKCGTGATGYRTTVFSTDTSVKPTAATDLGAGWPSTQACTWEITLFGKAAAVDAVVAANARNKLARPNGPVDGAYVTTSGYAFTTQ